MLAAAPKYQIMLERRTQNNSKSSCKYSTAISSGIHSNVTVIAHKTLTSSDIRILHTLYCFSCIMGPVESASSRVRRVERFVQRDVPSARWRRLLPAGITDGRTEKGFLQYAEGEGIVQLCPTVLQWVPCAIDLCSWRMAWSVTPLKWRKKSLDP